MRHTSRVTVTVLHRVYHEPLSLKDAVQKLAAGVNGLADSLVRPGDTRRYTEHLLARTVVCFVKDLAQLQQPLRLSQRYTQEQVVLQAIDCLVASNADNTLRIGYKKRGPHDRAGYTRGLHRAQQCHPSPTTSLLLAPEWCCLLARLGDELMLQLLLHGSIFAPLPGGNYLQLAGTPVHVVARDRTRLPCCQPPVADWLVKGNSSDQQHWQQLKSTPPAAAGVAATGQRVEASSILYGSAQWQPWLLQSKQLRRQGHEQHKRPTLQPKQQALPQEQLTAATAGLTRSKRCRPPPWLRKKLKMEQLQGQWQQQQQQLQHGQQQQHGLAPPDAQVLQLQQNAKQQQDLHLQQQEQHPQMQGQQHAGDGATSQQQLAKGDLPYNNDSVLVLDAMDSCDEPATQVLPATPLALWDFDDFGGTTDDLYAAVSPSASQSAVYDDSQQQQQQQEGVIELSAGHHRQQQRQETTRLSGQQKKADAMLTHQQQILQQQQQQNLCLQPVLGTIASAQAVTARKPCASLTVEDAAGAAGISGAGIADEGTDTGAAAPVPAAAATGSITASLTAAAPKAHKRAKVAGRDVEPDMWTVPRHSIFHCATFSKKAGLQASHILRQLHGKAAAARVLYSDIFLYPRPPDTSSSNKGRGTCDTATARRISGTSAAGALKATNIASSRGSKQQQQQRQHRQWQVPHEQIVKGTAGLLPAHAAAVRPGHRLLLRLLHRMIVRASRCPYGMLLNHHCPILRQKTGAAGFALTGSQVPPEPQLPGPTAKADAAAAAGLLQCRRSHRGPGRAGARRVQRQKQHRVLPVPLFSAKCKDAQQLQPQSIEPNQPQEPTAASNWQQQQQHDMQTQHQREHQQDMISHTANIGCSVSSSPCIQCGQGSGREYTLGSMGRISQGTGKNSSNSSPLSRQSPGACGIERHGVSITLHDAGHAQKHDQSGLADVLLLHQQHTGSSSSAMDIDSQAVLARTTAVIAPSTRHMTVPGTADQHHMPPANDAGLSTPMGDIHATPAQSGPQHSQPLGLAAQLVPHHAVVAYVWSVVRHVVPAALLGSKHNRQVLRGAIDTLVRLRRHENIRLDVLLHGMKTTHATWLHSKDPDDSTQAVPAVTAAAAPPAPAHTALEHRRRSIPLSLHVCQRRWLCCWMWWLLSHLMLPLLRNSFYVTEGEPYRQSVFYYRKPVWHQLTQTGLHELTGTCYSYISQAAAVAMLQNRQLGVSRLRLLPKRNGMRPIAKLGSSSIVRIKLSSSDGGRPRKRAAVAAAAAAAGETGVGLNWLGQDGSNRRHEIAVSSAAAAGRAAATSNGRAGHQRSGVRLTGRRGVRAGLTTRSAQQVQKKEVLSFKPVNFVLQPAFHVLRCELTRQPHVLGSSVFGLDDICRVLHPFLRRFRAAQAADPGLRPYIISADVRKAFDSVNIAKLVSLVMPLISSPAYQLLRYNSVSPMMGGMKVRYNTIAVPGSAIGTAAPAYSGAGNGIGNGRVAGQLTGCPSVPLWARAACLNNTNTLFADQLPHRSTLSCWEVKQLLQQHLTANLFRSGGTWLQQTVGIAQGSVASTLLCSLYLANLEQQHLVPLLPGLQGAVLIAEHADAATTAAGSLAAVVVGTMTTAGCADRNKLDSARAACAAEAAPAAVGAVAAAAGPSKQGGSVISSPCGISALAVLAAGVTSSSSPSGQPGASKIRPAGQQGQPHEQVVSQQQQQQQSQHQQQLQRPLLQAAPLPQQHKQHDDAQQSLQGQHGRAAVVGSTPVACAAGAGGPGVHWQTPISGCPCGLTVLSNAAGSAHQGSAPGSRHGSLSKPSSQSGSKHGSQSGGGKSSQSAGQLTSQSLSTDDPEKLPGRTLRLAAAAAGVSGHEQLCSPVAWSQAAAAITSALACPASAAAGSLGATFAIGHSANGAKHAAITAWDSNDFGAARPQGSSSGKSSTPGVNPPSSDPLQTLPVMLSLCNQHKAATGDKQKLMQQHQHPPQLQQQQQQQEMDHQLLVLSPRLPWLCRQPAGGAEHCGSDAMQQGNPSPTDSSNQVVPGSQPSASAGMAQQRTMPETAAPADVRLAATIAAAAAATESVTVSATIAEELLVSESPEQLLSTQPACTEVCGMDVDDQQQPMQQEQQCCQEDQQHEQRKCRQQHCIATQAGSAGAVSSGDASSCPSTDVLDDQGCATCGGEDAEDMACGSEGDSLATTETMGLEATEQVSNWLNDQGTIFQEHHASSFGNLQTHLQSPEGQGQISQQQRRQERHDQAQQQQAPIQHQHQLQQQQGQEQQHQTNMQPRQQQRGQTQLQKQYSQHLWLQQQEQHVPQSSQQRWQLRPHGKQQQQQQHGSLHQSLHQEVQQLTSQHSQQQQQQQQQCQRYEHQEPIEKQQNMQNQMHDGAYWEQQMSQGQVQWPLQQQQQQRQASAGHHQGQTQQQPATIQHGQGIQQQQLDHHYFQQTLAHQAQEVVLPPETIANPVTPAIDDSGTHKREQEPQQQGLLQHTNQQQQDYQQQHSDQQQRQRQQSSHRRRCRPDSVLLRLVDDFLAITTSRAAAEAFVARLYAGFPDHNCFINPNKTQLNFLVCLPDARQLVPNTWHSKDGSCWVRWCGLLFNVINLEIMADYTRYSGQHISSSLTLNRGARPGLLLQSKLLGYMRPKMHALLLDNSINSPLTVRLNIYQAFLLSFMKLHWAVRCLLTKRGPGPDLRLVLRAIQGAIGYCVGLVRNRVYAARRRLQLDVRCCVSRCHIRWLALTAARRVLSRKQASYKAVLAALNLQLADSAYRHVRVQLAPVVDPARSAVFDEVLY